MRTDTPSNETITEKARQAVERFVPYYRENALSQPCRKVELTGRKCRNPRIIRTLLGFELQIGGKRFSCPDLATASFLRLFALVGTREVMVPLDPTRSADMLPELEKRLGIVFDLCHTLEAREQKKAAQGLYNRFKTSIQESIGKQFPDND